jgi:hypothetical protein
MLYISVGWFQFLVGYGFWFLNHHAAHLKILIFFLSRTGFVNLKKKSKLEPATALQLELSSEPESAPKPSLSGFSCKFYYCYFFQKFKIYFVFLCFGFKVSGFSNMG